MEGFTAPPFITGLEHPCRLLVLKLHLIAQGLGHRCHAPERLGGSSNIRGSGRDLASLVSTGLVAADEK
jgi:hypothetical protein